MDLVIRTEAAADHAARGELLDLAFGQCRFAKTSERLREGRLPADSLSLVAETGGRLVGTVRLWHIVAGPGRAALLLGPLAVDASCRGQGIGAVLMHEALQRATHMGHQAVLLVGDAPYYARFGFDAALTARLWLPGPYEAARFLATELVPGALTGAHGLVSPTGLAVPQPSVAHLMAQTGSFTSPERPSRGQHLRAA